MLIISNEPIGRPNCSRRFAWTSALAMTARAARRAAASPSRPELRISSAILNPRPTSSRFSAGTLTLSNVTVRVSLALIPIFCSGCPSEMPGECASTMNAVTRCLRWPSISTGTLAKTVNRPAYPALEIQILVPVSV